MRHVPTRPNLPCRAYLAGHAHTHGAHVPTMWDQVGEVEPVCGRIERKDELCGVPRSAEKGGAEMEPHYYAFQPLLKPVPWRRIVLLLVLAVGIGAAAYVGINGG